MVARASSVVKTSYLTVLLVSFYSRTVLSTQSKIVPVAGEFGDFFGWKTAISADG
eukprot:SAG25_NODE_2819_length_1370_cov_1.508261_1_plen_54_part_10